MNNKGLVSCPIYLLPIFCSNFRMNSYLCLFKKRIEDLTKILLVINIFFFFINYSNVGVSGAETTADNIFFFFFLSTKCM